VLLVGLKDLVAGFEIEPHRDEVHPHGGVLDQRQLLGLGVDQGPELAAEGLAVFESS
jgi:hypothetical protein